jgi:hypothetical protein
MRSWFLLVLELLCTVIALLLVISWVAHARQATTTGSTVFGYALAYAWALLTAVHGAEFWRHIRGRT